ncbi:hypothetical protein N7493_011935 [Penicillium malachiteum]|uniref:Xylanolytic transcriptional activator regulatory domain-containing protein n=1 Tax=Penicillium malachiteum TaxID=1324776 RepID=A0AAD6MPT9_9EURO|nr:hypothetical protein N7493_011935 [Penicillium malachiteum]
MSSTANQGKQQHPPKFCNFYPKWASYSKDLLFLERGVSMSTRKFCLTTSWQCNGARPQCSRCLDHATDCTYGAEEDGRKPASKSYVEALRGRINLLEQILQLHSIDIKAGIATLNERAGLNDVDSANSPAEGLNSAAQMQELQMAFEGTLSLEDPANFEQDGEAHYFGPTSSRLEFRETDHNIPPDRLVERNYHPMDDSPATMSSAATPSDSRAKLYARIRVADTKRDIAEEPKMHLIDLFFAWQNPWLQVVDEALFRESRSSNGRYCSLLLEYCILSFGSRFTDNREVRSDPEDPSTAGQAFYEKAQLILQHLAPILLAGSAKEWLIAWQLTLGLNIDVACLAGSNSMPPQEIELRRNIYWALFCDDKLAAAYTGRVCALPVCPSPRPDILSSSF